jgi:hypothetical protein
MIWFVLYIAAIVLANWLITIFGLVPIGPLLVPAGSFAAGLTFGLRDLLQRDKGRWWAIVAIVIGAALSAILSPQLAVASGVAFLLSELLDLAVYTRLLERGWVPAVVLSNLAGGMLDTWVFLVLAGFFSWPAFLGVVVVKWAATVPVLLVWRWQRDLAIGRRPA